MEDSKQQQDISDSKAGTSSAGTISSNQALFTLSAILEAHQPQDAKCVAEIANGGLVTGGRDGIMKIWKFSDGGYENSIIVPQQDCFAINSIAVGGLEEGDCLIFVGRKNGSIAIFSMENGFSEPIKVLQGHKSNVCALHFDQTTCFLMSGSWDHNAAVWPMRSLLRGTDSQVGIGLLTGHRCSVWAVATVPTAPEPPQFLTGSADKTILLWGADYEQRRFFQGHTDVVRAIVVLSAQHFLSSSNDASIRLWDIASGSNLRTFYPDHQEFLYTLAKLDSTQHDSPLIIACGEGGSIDIWALKGQAHLEHKQALRIPVHSVWFVAPLSNGDFAVATSSGYVLIFTTQEARKAADDIQEFFYTSQYEALEAKNQEMQKTRDGTEFDTFNGGSAQNGGGEMWRRIGAGDSSHFASGASVPYQDPFTGTNRYVPGNGADAPISKPEKRSPIVPLPDNFCTFGLDGVSKKVLDRLREMNLAQTKELKMNDDEICSTEQILTETEFAINECQVVALEKGMEWSPETILPALDIFRIALLHPQLNEIFCSLRPVLGNPPKGAATMRRLLNLLTLADCPDPVRILVCRSLANAVAHEHGRAMLLSQLTALWGGIAKHFRSSKTALQIATSAALLNLARILLQKTEQKEIVELGPREDALHALIDGLSATDFFTAHAPLALVRLLQALILLLGRGAVAGCLRFEELKKLAEAMRKMKDAVADDDVKSLTRELSDMIGAI